MYIAGRSPVKIAAAIEALKPIYTDSPGHLKSLPFDLSNLTTISTCASTFLNQESRLDVLFNSAGIGRASGDSTSAPRKMDLCVWHSAQGLWGPQGGY